MAGLDGDDSVVKFSGLISFLLPAFHIAQICLLPIFYGYTDPFFSSSFKDKDSTLFFFERASNRNNVMSTIRMIKVYIYFIILITLIYSHSGSEYPRIYSLSKYFSRNFSISDFLSSFSSISPFRL